MYIVTFNNYKELGKVIFPTDYSLDYVIKYMNIHYKDANPVLEWESDIRRLYNQEDVYDLITFENTIYPKFLLQLENKKKNYSV